MSPYIYCTEFISEMQFCFLFFKFTVKLIAHSLKWKIPCSTLIFGLPLPFSPHIDRKNTPAGPNKYEKANGVLHMRKGNGKKNECLYWHIQRAEELIKLIICLIFFKKNKKKLTETNKTNYAISEVFDCVYSLKGTLRIIPYYRISRTFPKLNISTQLEIMQMLGANVCQPRPIYLF